MTVKELIEELKNFPEDMEVLNYEYDDIHDVYKDTYIEKEYVLIN